MYYHIVEFLALKLDNLIKRNIHADTIHIIRCVFF